MFRSVKKNLESRKGLQKTHTGYSIKKEIKVARKMSLLRERQSVISKHVVVIIYKAQSRILEQYWNSIGTVLVVHALSSMSSVVVSLSVLMNHGMLG